MKEEKGEQRRKASFFLWVIFFLRDIVFGDIVFGEILFWDILFWDILFWVIVFLWEIVFWDIVFLWEIVFWDIVFLWEIVFWDIVFWDIVFWDIVFLWEIVLFIEIGDDLRNGLLDGNFVVPDVHFWSEGCLIRRTDAGELLDHAFSRLLIEPLWIPPLRDLNRHVHEDLYKRQATTTIFLLVQLAGGVPVGPVRRDEGGDGDAGAIREQLRHLGDASDVLVAVFLAEAQVLVQSESDVVAVQPVGGHATLAEQVMLQLDRDRGLA